MWEFICDWILKSFPLSTLLPQKGQSWKRDCNSQREKYWRVDFSEGIYWKKSASNVLLQHVFTKALKFPLLFLLKESVMRFFTSVICQTFTFLLRMPKYRLFKLFALKFYKLRLSVVYKSKLTKLIHGKDFCQILVALSL